MKDRVITLSTKTAWFLAATIVLVLTLTINITYTFFNAGTSMSGVITMGDLEISTSIDTVSHTLEIEEGDILGGEVIQRSLEITNESTSDNAYIRIKTLFTIDSVQSFDVEMVLGGAQTGWTRGYAGPEYYYYYDSILNAGNSTTVAIQFIVYPYEEVQNYGISNEDSGKPYSLQLLVEAIQSSGSAYATWDSDRLGS
ncbi:MAG: TasA family protein [Spirochaetales bacterium]